MKYYLALFCALSSFAVTAQKLTVSGKVVDKETREPLPFASVGILGKSIGTVTNLQGEFDFHLNSEFKDNIFAINMLGYKTFEAPVWALLTDSLVIQIEKSTVILDEVVVSDSLKGGDILHIALLKIDENYPKNPYVLEGFYRDLKKVANTYVSLLEAAVSIYDEDYKEPRNKFKLRERVALKEVRRSIGYSSKFTSFFDQGNLLEDLLLHNSIRYRHFPEEDEFLKQLTREKDTDFNNRPVYVITHKLDQVKLLIDKKTFAILHLEDENTSDLFVGKKRGLVSKLVKVKRVIDFKAFEGVMYLNYLSVNSQINWFDGETNDLKFETELNQILLINSVEPNTSKKIGLGQKMKNYGLQYQDQAYNKAFWDNYNVLKESQLDKKIISDLEREQSLEHQFGDNH
ncbi:MAG: carboxypeptidase-like regulatory domain-containing protein [Cyclobacteriaceae bacterium]|nr:carboxypeptidase-like regulatory domain-containing protein [Cyclobacteriaceae bacterium]